MNGKERHLFIVQLVVRYIDGIGCVGIGGELYMKD